MGAAVQHIQSLLSHTMQKSRSTLEEMKKNEQTVLLSKTLAAVQKNGHALEYASEEMKKNEQIVLAAVQQDGCALRYASEEMKQNEQIVLAAVQQHGFALQFAP